MIGISFGASGKAGNRNPDRNGNRNRNRNWKRNRNRNGKRNLYKSRDNIYLNLSQSGFNSYSDYIRKMREKCGIGNGIGRGI